MERTGIEQWKPREVARLLALVETERRYYQEIVAALPVALAVLSSERIIVSSNRAFRQLVQLTGDELRQKNIEQILPSDELIERIRAAHVHGDTGMFRISTGDRNFRAAAIPIRGWDEEMEAETLLMLDAFETPPAEMRAEAQPAPVAPEAVPEPEPQEPKPAVDLSTLPAAIWQADAATFQFTYAGGSTETLLGYSNEHLLAEPLLFSDRIHPEDREEVMALYRDAVAKGGEVTAEFRAVRASGETVRVRETIQIPEPGVGDRRVSGVTSGIGQRRTIEAMALQSGRTDALRGLASRLAHDLNNPLTIVTGYSEEILSSLPESDPRRGDLQEILSAARRVEGLAGNLLDFARMQAKAPTMIAMSNVLAILEPQLRSLASEVEFAFPEGSVWTLADADQLGEAVGALAAFVVQSTSGAARLTVTCGPSTITERIENATLKPGVYARLDLRADGKAVASARAALESVLPSKEFGKDALAATRGYLNILQWGGDIAYAADARGSTLTLYLPYAASPYTEPVSAPGPVEDVVAEPVIEMPLPAAPEPEPPPLGTILLVEDESGIRGLVRKILRRERYEVLEAGTAEEALAAVAEHEGAIDLLLTDVLLPGMSGRELAQSLCITYADLKVIYVSGFTGDEEVRAGEFPPGSRFLQKPFTLGALVSAVKEAIGD